MSRNLIAGSAILLVVAAATMAYAPAIAHAQNPDVRNIRPTVMLLVDTSGSMERTADCVCSSASCSNCLPDCDANTRNKWSYVVEAFTGTFPSFECQRRNRSIYVGDYDYNYFIPHYEIVSTSQLTNGVLDVYSDRVRFGLMTFDTVGTLTSANTLVAHSDWTPTFVGQSQGLDGMYSYGEVRPFNYPGCTFDYAIDVGARGETPPGGTGTGELAGNLISVGPEADYLTVNERIQNSFLEVRPYGATPVAGMLHDLQFYLGDHPDVTPIATAGGAGDPYAACRPRYAILVTDGYPNADMRDAIYGDGTGTCASAGHTCPYPTPEELAASLCNQNVSGDCEGDLDGLFVVGFNITSDPSAVALLNSIADVGGTGDIVRTITSGPDGALYADDTAALQSALSAILDSTAPGTTTRTVPAFAQPGVSSSSAQFQFNTGFQQTSTLGEPWAGYLERRRFTCDGTTPEEQPVTSADQFHTVMSAQPTRSLYTVVPSNSANVSGFLTGTGASELSTSSLPVPPTSLYAPAESGLSTTPITSATAAHFGVGSSGERQDILDFLSGAGRSHKLADIYHSSPVIVTAPEVDRADESFNQFRNQSVVASRPTVVYVGTNDGVLHAFLADDFAGQAAGTELWGFIPPAVFPNLASATSSHQILLDGTPVVKDVFRARLQSALPDADEYRTVLVVGLRGGGDAYFALDVTDPTVAPVFLWQFSHPQLGDAYATPALAQVQVDIEGTTHQRSVAILPGGEGSLLGPACAAPTGVVTSGLNGAQRVERRCWDSRGRSLFVVDVTSGHLMRVFESTNLYAPMTGGVAVFPAEVGTLSTRAFMSDGDGMIWRLDLRQADMDEWAITPFHDVFYNGGSTEKGEPAYFPPVLSTDVSGNVVVLQATGNVDLLDGTSANRVVSLLEQVEYDGSGEYDPATDISATLNWEEVLDPGEQVTGPLELFAGVVYFGSFASQVSALDACLYGSSRIWGVGYIDNAPAFETAPEIFSKTLGPYDNQIVMGVAVTRRPSCFVETPSFDPYGSAYYNIVDQGGGGFELVAQISGGGTAATGGTISEVSIQLPPPDAFVNVESIAGSID